MSTANETKTRPRSGLFRAADDTIAAIATPVGTGGVAIIRISGPEAAEVLEKTAPAHKDAQPGMMVFGPIMDGETKVDEGYSVFFAAPHSYTGEDTAELQCHGGQVVTGEVLAAVIHAGARPAEPGEFTKRAFLNGRMDLSQAEAVGDLIGAVGVAAAEVAQRQIGGQIKRRLEDIQSRLADMIAEIEADLEYPDEDLEETEAPNFTWDLEQMRSELLEMAESWNVGRVLKNGLRVAIAGAPNAGKSSLFNALCGGDKAIVATVPGTTRDVLETTIATVDGTILELVDTAGIRHTDDPIETEGVRRAQQAAQESDLILYVIDGSTELHDEDVQHCQNLRSDGRDIICILNKSDLERAVPEKIFTARYGTPLLPVSVLTGDGLEVIKKLLYAKAGGPALSEDRVLITDLRQKEHLEKAAEHLDEAMAALHGQSAFDLACVDLRSAWVELGEIVGNTASEEIIDRIFSKFCLGK